MKAKGRHKHVICVSCDQFRYRMIVGSLPTPAPSTNSFVGFFLQFGIVF